MKGLTSRQAEVLAFIRRFISDRGMPPTVREIARAFGIRSTLAVSDHLRALKRKGAIEIDREIARGIRIVRGDPPPPKIAVFWYVGSSVKGYDQPKSFSVLVDGGIICETDTLADAVAIAKEAPVLCARKAAS